MRSVPQLIALAAISFVPFLLDYIVHGATRRLNVRHSRMHAFYRLHMNHLLGRPPLYVFYNVGAPV